LVPCSKDNTIESDESAVSALQLMQRTGASRLMVTDRGRLVGVIALKDLLRLLALKIELKDLDQ
jgi:predicted transcriptional regulator